MKKLRVARDEVDGHEGVENVNPALYINTSVCIYIYIYVVCIY